MSQLSRDGFPAARSPIHPTRRVIGDGPKKVGPMRPKPDNLLEYRLGIRLGQLPILYELAVLEAGPLRPFGIKGEQHSILSALSYLIDDFSVLLTIRSKG